MRDPILSDAIREALADPRRTLGEALCLVLCVAVGYVWLVVLSPLYGGPR